MIEKLKLLYPALNPTILSLLLDNATNYFIDYCNVSEVPTSASGVIFRMVQEDVNRLQAEGIASENAAGNSVSYNEDYSKQVIRMLNKYKHIKTVK